MMGAMPSLFDTRSMRYLLAVADLDSMTAAAAYLEVAQPALNQAQRRFSRDHAFTARPPSTLSRLPPTPGAGGCGLCRHALDLCARLPTGQSRGDASGPARQRGGAAGVAVFRARLDARSKPADGACGKRWGWRACVDPSTSMSLSACDHASAEVIMRTAKITQV